MAASELVNEIKLDPEPGILIESLRDIGYSFNSALADIVDNSITAHAINIRVLAIPADEFKIAIIDDGDGLSRNNLMQAMRLGSTDPRQERTLNDLGRFGLGLKTASFSQCRRLTVCSRKNGVVSAFTWDLDLVVANNEWTVIERQAVDEIPFLRELGSCGTLVLWEKLDRLGESKDSGKVDFARLISEAQDYLALVFHRYLAGERGLKKIQISVNNLVLEPIDPFNTQHKATQASPLEVVCPGVTIQAYTLPHRSNYASVQEYDQYGLPGGYLKNQGVYIYRARRLILFGTWFNLMKKTALTQLSRVRIDIETSQDEFWKIDVKKVSAQMPEIVRSRLKALIQTIGAPSKKVYKRRGAKLTSPDVFPIWQLTVNGEKSNYRINRDHPVIQGILSSFDSADSKSIETLISLIESTFPKDSIFYEISRNEEGVEFPSMEDDEFAIAARSFFAALKQTGKEEEIVISMMAKSEPFASRWEETKKVLGIEEDDG